MHFTTLLSLFALLPPVLAFPAAALSLTFATQTIAPGAQPTILTAAGQPVKEEESFDPPVLLDVTAKGEGPRQRLPFVSALLAGAGVVVALI